MAEAPALICRRCSRVVRVSADHYETFERMHWVCFHYEFEHDLGGDEVDPDEDCGIPGCPSGPMAVPPADVSE